MNGCFFNSKVWSGFSSNDLKDLKVLDHQTLRLIIGAQAKVPIEMLYLETAQLPVENIISVRRLLYLKTILNRHDTELIRQVYSAMKEDQIKGDWIHLVKKKIKEINLNMSNDDIEKIPTATFRQLI